MKRALVIITLLITTITIGQTIKTERLWKTKGVYDSLGAFVKEEKVQQFLCSSKSNQFYRLVTQDRLNMETGETTVFIYRDTLNLQPMTGNTFKIDDKKTLILHSNDSLTLQYSNGYSMPFVKLDIKPNRVDLETFTTALQKEPLVETVENSSEYRFTYKDNGLVKVKTLDRDYEYDSEYKIIDFHGFIILQGIVSAPKLITKIKKGTISFLEIDYRFETKKGTFSSK